MAAVDETMEEIEVVEEDAPSKKLIDELDEIEPMWEKREQVLRLGDLTKTYVQQPLGFFAKMRFTAVIGTALDEAMSGDNALSIAALFGPVNRPGATLTANDFQEAELFVRGITKLASTAPELLSDVYCIALGVPANEMIWAKIAMEQHPADGGLSDDDGMEILDTFIDQNGEALRSFFTEKITELMKRARNRLGTDPASPKPSRATRRATQKQSKN